MNVPALIAAAYLGQLGIKTGLALTHRAREVSPPPAALARLTVIQPVTSGDEQLGAVLKDNLREWPGVAVIWIIDETDPVARVLCQSLRAAHPDHDILIVEAIEPPAGLNPKIWKQAAALPHVQTELLAVIDDDTRVPRASVDLLIHLLDAGADLVTGLPSYIPARQLWSRLVAEFVNSSAILTYLSAAACTEPVSINGMCYALRTDYVRRLDLFTVCNRAVTDDLAVAREVRAAGGRLTQTTRPQHITTTVTSLTHYRRLMHRWFVCTRLLVQSLAPYQQILLLLAYGLHPLLLAGLFVSAIVQPGVAIWPLLGVLAVRAVVLALLNRIFTGSWRHAPVASVVAELLQPVLSVGAFLQPVIWWRRRKIRVRGLYQFEYLSS